jgi:hypothetical protein
MSHYHVHPKQMCTTEGFRSGVKQWTRGIPSHGCNSYHRIATLSPSCGKKGRAYLAQIELAWSDTANPWSIGVVVSWLW